MSVRNWTLLLFLGGHRLAAQAPAAEPPPPIMDNSFLVEEAYNQERGVVQHINTFSHSVHGTSWVYTFTQEWPLSGQRHQLSYTIPVAREGDASPATTGIGDIAINYRYQALGISDTRFAFAPRLTVLLPTGDSRRGLGAGGTGFQLNLPFSAALSSRFVAHSNAGVTFTPRARNALDNSAPTLSYALGQSVIWLVHPKLNLLLENAWTVTQDVIGSGQTERRTELLLSPGLRGAIDFASGLQIVPGIAFPFGIGHDRGESSVFLYLSFEHPFGHRAP